MLKGEIAFQRKNNRNPLQLSNYINDKIDSNDYMDKGCFLIL